MLNEHKPEFEKERKETESFLIKKLGKRFTDNFVNIRFVKDSNPNAFGSIEPLGNNKYNMRLEPKNIQVLCNKFNVEFNKSLKCIAIHEVFHIVFPELDQTKAFNIKDATGDSSEYKRIEELNWEYVIKEFPEFNEIINSLKQIYG